MLTCIACLKQLNSTNESVPDPQEEEDYNAHTPSTKQAIKSLTVQIKDIALKASWAYKNCKPCAGHDRDRGYRDSDVGSVSERFYGLYRRTGGSQSTRPWFDRKEAKAKIMGLSSGSATPASVSSRMDSVVFVEEDEPKEWVANVEPGVLITFVSLPHGGNDLKRIRFSREIFDKWKAQKWWAENCDKVKELYNVHRFDQKDGPLPTPPEPEDLDSARESGEESPVTPPLSKERYLPRHFHRSPATNRTMPPHRHQSPSCRSSTPKHFEEASSIDASARSSTSSRNVDRSGELSTSDIESEWVEQDEPGVYITLRALPHGGRELRRVRFSREVFGETQARVWWEENKARIQKQYL